MMIQSVLFLIIAALPDLPEEDRLLDRARLGNRQAIADIYEIYFDPIYQFIRWRVYDPSLAEDLTSDVFIKFLSALQGPNAPRQSLRGWLFRVARNILHDHYARPGATDALDEDIPAPENSEIALMRALDAERVREAIRALAEDQQTVLILRFGQMMSLQDTAESMDRSVSAIKSLQFRAINALRHTLRDIPLEAEYGAI